MRGPVSAITSRHTGCGCSRIAPHFVTGKHTPMAVVPHAAARRDGNQQCHTSRRSVTASRTSKPGNQSARRDHSRLVERLTFCSAWAWKRYSLPIRRAGSPVQASRGPRIAKSTPAACSSLAVDSRRGARALVERRGAADPVEDLGRRLARLEDAHAELRRPSRRARSARGPTGCRRARRRAASARPRPGSASRPSRGCGAGRRCGRRARSRPGTPARTRRRSRSPRPRRR